MTKRLLIAAGACLLLAACGDKATTTASNTTTTETTTASAQAGSGSGSTGGGSKHIPAPKRNAGWWEFTDVAPNGDQLSKTNLCVGEKSEAVYSAFDQIGGSLCDSKSFEKTAEGYSYTTVCGVPGMKPTTAKGKITGDIATAYTMEEVLDISVEGDHQKKTAKLIAPACPAGFADGDESTMNGAMKSSVMLGR